MAHWTDCLQRYECENLQEQEDSDDGVPMEKDQNRYPAKDGNLISSKIEGSSRHFPVLDLDFEAVLIDSKTPGNHHLYLNKDVSWQAYKNLLKALFDAELINDGFYHRALLEEATFCRSTFLEQQVGAV